MKQAVHLLKSRALGMAIMLVLTALSVLLFRDGGAVEAMHADAQTGVPLPILMYHSVLKDPQRSGSYIITPAQFEKDMLYLNEHGYTTVLPSDLLRYAKGEGELPEKPVMITFDDGYYNNLVYVLPILKRLQLKAVISIGRKLYRRGYGTYGCKPNVCPSHLGGCQHDCGFRICGNRQPFLCTAHEEERTGWR
jgi:hypothetical protein